MDRYQWAVFEANLDPAAGSEQKGKRPVLIVSNEEFNQAMPVVTVLPLTSTRRPLYPSEVRLAEGRAGQPLESIILSHQIRTISKQRLGQLLGYLEDRSLQDLVKQAMQEHLDLD
jgi:mRNA interferase MazF